MIYTLLNIIFLAAAVVVAIASMSITRQRTKLGGTASTAEKRQHARSEVRVWGAIAATLLVMIVFTAVFDNIMIAVGLVAYDQAHISGIKIGLAPLEDFAYTVAAVILLPAVWNIIPPLKKRNRSGHS